MANRTRYPRDPEKYPEEDSYPEIMSKMDPLIIRISPTVLLVGSTTYTAKIKLGYRFNGFHVNVTGVGIPIYKQEVDIKNMSTTNLGKNGMSDAYNYVEYFATLWMDDLEKSMLKDSKEKNVVDLLREIKYQMHFDLSGHKYPAITPGTEEYDERMEVCPEVPTYITDIYKLLAEMNARLNNLMVVMASDGTGSDSPTDPNYGKNRIINNVTATYNDNTHGFDVAYDYGERVTAGLNERIGDINNPKPNSVVAKLNSISNNVDTVATNVDTVANDVVSLKGQSAVNAVVIADSITNGLNQLVSQMNSMNAKIGSSIGTDDTLFSLSYDINGKMGTTASTADGTIFAYLNNNKDVLYPAIMNELIAIEGKPIFSMDADHVTYLSYWGQDMYDSQHDNLYDRFYRLLKDALNYGSVGGRYETGSDRGFSTLNGPAWGINVMTSN